MAITKETIKKAQELYSELKGADWGGELNGQDIWRECVKMAMESEGEDHSNDNAPKYPREFDRRKKQYVAKVEEDGSRTFFGTRTNWTRGGAANYAYSENEHPENLPIGTVLEIRNGSNRHLCTWRVQKTESGWVVLSSREKDVRPVRSRRVR